MIDAGRFVLRDFVEADRAAFAAYQNDPRYRALYDLPENEEASNGLFDRFMSWQNPMPRANWQFAIAERETDKLLGTAGLRGEGMPANEAVIGIELAPEQWGRYRLALDVTQALVEWAFRERALQCIIAETSDGNRRAERVLARLGATKQSDREGPEWMQQRGWRETIWMLER